MRDLRDYQARAVRRVREEWDAGRRRVCLVAPTGSGKTTIGAALVGLAVTEGARVVWVAHRRELVAQAAERLQQDGLDVGALCPGLPERDAPVQVGTIQTLLARDLRPPAELVVLDEAHHYATASRDWSSFGAAYGDRFHLGLTATPQRRDGSPLGDVFDGLVEAASYSELVRAGHLVECHVLRDDALIAKGLCGPRSWAASPAEALVQLGPGHRAIVFVDRVERAEEVARDLVTAGFRAEALDAETPAVDRARMLAAFQAGALDALVNVYVLTEGVDLPEADVCVLARGCEHASTYLQMVGRVLRPASGKAHATLVDLTGVSAEHGLPTRDRVYTLDGTGIVDVDRATSRTCLECGHVYAVSLDACPRCGALRPRQEMPEIRIWSRALQQVYAGAETPRAAREAEYRRLRRLCTQRGWSLGFVVREYEKLFLERPLLDDVTLSEWREEHRRLLQRAAERGYKPGWVAHRYRDLAGQWPPRAWAADLAVPFSAPSSATATSRPTDADDHEAVSSHSDTVASEHAD